MRARDQPGQDEELPHGRVPEGADATRYHSEGGRRRPVKRVVLDEDDASVAEHDYQGGDPAEAVEGSQAI